MHRREYLRGALGALTAAASGLAGCSESGSSAATATGPATPVATATESATRTATATETATPRPTPETGTRSLSPYRSWLVAPTPATPGTYEFTHLSLSAVRADASESFAASLDRYWRQRTASYFGVEVPVDAIDAVLTVNHSRVAGESYRVAGGSFDPRALRESLVAAGFDADGAVDGVQRLVRTAEGQVRVVGLHPDVLVSIGADASATAPLASALDQHRRGAVRTDEDEALAALVEGFGTADYVTGRELEPAAEDYPLSSAVATGRRLDVRESTSWAERAYVLPPDAAIDRAAVEEEIRTRHAGQPIEEFRREGRLVTVAGEVENSLIRLL
ncbi:hypothetical protein [Haloplanus halophilus]|uniref:hypothetical protein n=1 Tax=Haloplanus halophilus TaxID=2949993 RepID=UPI00203BC1C9|nr:hypothetical protein [Haloplanus sp. GDY1]